MCCLSKNVFSYNLSPCIVPSTCNLFRRIEAQAKYTFKENVDVNKRLEVYTKIIQDG